MFHYFLPDDVRMPYRCQVAGLAAGSRGPPPRRVAWRVEPDHFSQETFDRLERLLAVAAGGEVVGTVVFARDEVGSNPDRVDVPAVLRVLPMRTAAFHTLPDAEQMQLLVSPLVRGMPDDELVRVLGHDLAYIAGQPCACLAK